MKHNHIEEALLIIAASAFAVHVRNHFMIDNGIYEFTYPFRILAEGEVLQALVYSSPFLFYVLALLIFRGRTGPP